MEYFNHQRQDQRELSRHDGQDWEIHPVPIIANDGRVWRTGHSWINKCHAPALKKDRCLEIVVLENRVAQRKLLQLVKSFNGMGSALTNSSACERDNSQ